MRLPGETSLGTWWHAWLAGIIAEEVVEAMPPLLMALVHRLVRWGVIAPSRAPDSAIINIYEEDDCIPPHIDHHDFSRPFVTLSLLSQENIMFGYKLIPFAPGEFGCRDDSGECEIPLPPGEYPVSSSDF